jgi:hypothetical protein
VTLFEPKSQALTLDDEHPALSFRRSSFNRKASLLERINHCAEEAKGSILGFLADPNVQRYQSSGRDGLP